MHRYYPHSLLMGSHDPMTWSPTIDFPAFSLKITPSNPEGQWAPARCRTPMRHASHSPAITQTFSPTEAVIHEHIIIRKLRLSMVHGTKPCSARLGGEEQRPLQANLSSSPRKGLCYIPFTSAYACNMRGHSYLMLQYQMSSKEIKTINMGWWNG